jgi:hypothetical protein
MMKTQVQIPDELFRKAKDVAAAKEWSFAEIVRRGLEYMVSTHPTGCARTQPWCLPSPIDLGLVDDPFTSESWREEANLSSGASKLTAPTAKPHPRRGRR